MPEHGSHQNIQSVILSGGFATRSGLEGTPKALITASNGETLLGHLLKDLEGNGFDNCRLITNSLHANQLKEEVGRLGLKIGVDIVDNGAKTPEERKGALGDLLIGAKGVRSDVSLAVFSSDYAYWKSFNVSDLLNFASQEKYEDAFITMAWDTGDKNIVKGNYGCPEIDEDGFVTSFEEKPSEPKSTLAVLAFYVYRPEQIKLVEEFKNEGGNIDSPSNIIPFLLKKGVRVAVMVVGKDVVDAGTPVEIAKAKAY